jgi:predicted kinase
MTRNLIIIRGNSASGKTTVATELQKRLGRRTMLLSQDVIRRQILRVSDKEEHPAMDLIQQIARFGWEKGWETVIIEGILSRAKYGEKLLKLAKEADKTIVYYLDISFEETLTRHTMKPEADNYGEKEMRDWWLENDVLGLSNEITLDESLTSGEIVSRIVHDIA